MDPATGRPAAPAPTPDSAFGRGSGINLAPVARDMAEVRSAAGHGELRMDEETAQALLKDLWEIKVRVEQLTTDAHELDVPLKLGDNWVGHAMSRRLHSVARGQDSAAIRVFKQFLMVVEDYELTVRRAAHLYTTMEDDVQSNVQRAARQLDVIDGSSS